MFGQFLASACAFSINKYGKGLDAVIWEEFCSKASVPLYVHQTVNMLLNESSFRNQFSSFMKELATYLPDNNPLKILCNVA